MLLETVNGFKRGRNIVRVRVITTDDGVEKYILFAMCL